MNGKRSLQKKMEHLHDVNFSHRDYLWIEPLPGDTIYCDPPYVGTTTYKGTNTFDHTVFWNWCEWQRSRGVLVFVSEFNGPLQYVLAEFTSKSDMHTTKREQRTSEKLFMLTPHARF